MTAINSNVKNGIIVARFTDAEIVDEARIQQIGKELMEIASEAGQSESKKMLLNFQGVQCMSSAMIGKLVVLNKTAKVAGVVLKFCSISPNVLEVFKITRLDNIFKIIDDDDPGTAGSLARLIRPPDTGGGQASPEKPDADGE